MFCPSCGKEVPDQSLHSALGVAERLGADSGTRRR
jgi:hypothetical protein